MSDLQADVQFQPRTLQLFRAMAVTGLLASVAGMVLESDRAWSTLLILSIGVVGIGVGAAAFLAVHRLSGAGWATALRRVPEALVALIPIGGMGLLLVLILRPALYPWTNPDAHLAHMMVGFKGWWLNRPFFLARAAAYLLIWSALGAGLVRASRAQDADSTFDGYRSRGRLAGMLAATLGITYCLASFDWIMSLEPEWYSTVFGFYNIAGMFVSVLALMTILAVWLRRRGDLQGVLNSDHLHDLGKLLMGFCTVWAYLWFCQYMLIWYSNIPEETVHYTLRRTGAWNSVFFLNLVVNWALPFLLLLPASVKRSGSAMVKIAILLLVGRVVDLYLMVAPSVLGKSGPHFGFVEIGMLVGAIGLVALLTIRGLNQASILPQHDPRFDQSLHYHS